MCNQPRMLTLLWYINFICVMKTSASNEDLFEGSVCQHLGVPGICKRMTDCPEALHAAENGRSHQLFRCKFANDKLVVCCPDLSQRIPTVEPPTIDRSLIWTNLVINDTTSKPNATTKRKCEIMCEKIYKDNNIRPGIEQHVINGVNAKLGQFPHMASIGYQVGNDIDWMKCGASLISPRFLLTAAHCLFCIDCYPKKVRIGVIDIRNNQSAQDIDITNVTVNKNYNYNTKHNDIALIELVKDVNMSKIIYPACLHTGADDPPELWISGWGQIDRFNLSSRSEILKTAIIEPVSVEKCNITIVKRNQNSAKTIVNSQICATFTSDACVGDSGGPLQIRKLQGGFEIVGIVSYGIGCGSLPGIYTRVSAYLDWIESVVWPD